MNVKPLLFGLLFLAAFNATAQQTTSKIKNSFKTGPDRTEAYVDYLKGKKIAIVATPASIIGDKPMVDSLLSLGVKIAKIFGPEHGFRGNASAGVKVEDEVDAATGIPVISLYGKKNKPSKEDMAGLVVMIFDLPDVGTRFYTNINALARVMESCAENNVELMIMDRPNPNGYLVDGPILDMSLKSGIGMFPIPIAHGLTMAEFAQMLNGEGWLANKMKCKLKIIPMANYYHDMPYTMPVKPSPNLNTQQAILLYPSTCLFEGTYLNHGRGTMYPFTVLGSPLLKGKYEFSYTPKSIKGMSETPLFQDQVCYGIDLRNYNTEQLRKSRKINLKWLMELYQAFPEKEKFFDSSLSKEMGNIDKLSGTRQLRQQIISGASEAEIRKSWEPGLSQFKKMRKQYLLYK